MSGLPKADPAAMRWVEMIRAAAVSPKVAHANAEMLAYMNARFDPTMDADEHLAVVVALLGARLAFLSPCQRNAAACAVAALAVDGAHYTQLSDPAAEHANTLPA